ncbi:MAG: biopolymer transporter ExbD [Phycisphaerales bacterium]|nr:biopolymer transporter ExbD [Phycisphaerales bacterium]
MRFSSSQRRHRLNRAAVNLSSMIDVTFLLLVYFIVTTVLTPPEDLLTPALKVEDGSSLTQEDLEPQIVEVILKENVPTYTLGGHLCTNRKELVQVLAKLPVDPGLIIRVGGDVPVGFAVTAIQTARDVGFLKVTYVPTKE